MTNEHGTATNEDAWLVEQTDWLPVLLRAVIVLFLVPGSAIKFVDYAGQASFFAGLGIPAAEVTVLVIGVLELSAAVMIATGAAGRVGAVLVIPIMVTAIVLTGPVVSNVAVLVGSLGVAVLGTGRYSLWEPADEAVTRMLTKLSSTG